MTTKELIEKYEAIVSTLQEAETALKWDNSDPYLSNETKHSNALIILTTSNERKRIEQFIADLNKLENNEDKLKEALSLALQYVPCESKDKGVQKEIAKIHQLIKCSVEG